MFFSCKRWIPIAMVAVTIFGISGSAKAESDSLANLIDNGGTLTDGNFSYFNFQFLSDIGTNPLDLSQINVQTVNNLQTGLDFLGNGQFTLDPSDSNSIILQIAFDVAASGSPVQFSGVGLTGAEVGGLGLVDVFNSISDAAGNQLATTNAILDPGFGISQPFDSQALGGAFSNLSFETSLSLFSDANSTVSLDSFRVTVAVPEPTIATLLGCGIAGLTLVRRRRI